MNETTKTGFTAHPLAEMFPPLDPKSKEYAELVRRAADEKGLQVVLHEGKVLDGRAAQDACLEVGVDPHYLQYEGDDPVGFVWLRNFARRHLTLAQKAAAYSLFKEKQRKAAQKSAPTNKQAVTSRPPNESIYYQCYVCHAKITIAADAYVRHLRTHADAGELTDDQIKGLEYLESLGSVPDLVVGTTPAADPGANLHRAQADATGGSKGRTAEAVAKVIGGSPRSVNSALTAIRKAPEVREPMLAGELSIHAANKIANNPDIVAKIRAGELTVRDASKPKGAARPQPSIGPGWKDFMLVTVRIETGKDDEGRRDAIYENAFRIAHAGAPARNAFVLVHMDNDWCANPFKQAPHLFRWAEPKSRTLASCDIAMLRVGGSRQADDERERDRLRCEAARADVQAELDEALSPGPDFEALAKLE